MDKYMESTVLPILKDVGACWQPSDFLPDPSSPDFLDEVRIFPCDAVFFLAAIPFVIGHDEHD